MKTNPYKTIVRLKPIIESSPELVERLKNCFDYTLKKRRTYDKIPEPKELITDKDNNSRYIFRGFGVNDPLTKEEVYFVLKTSGYGRDLVNYSFTRDASGKFGREDDLMFLMLELQHLEDSEEHSLLGVVADYRYNEAGLLMTDYSENGRFRVKGISYGESLEIYSGNKLIKTVCNDLKRCQGFIRSDRKYLNSGAVVELK